MSPPHTSHADLGGRDLPGAVVPEAEDERFHAPWEPRALALTLAMGATGAWNLDAARAARESLPDYAQLSYYAIWIYALERLLESRGLCDPDERAAGRAVRPAARVPRVLKAADVPRVLAAGSPTQRAAARPAAYAVGQHVRTATGPFDHHVRLPGYVHGKLGRIESVHGMHVFPDTHAHGQGEQPQWLYTVVFEGREVWGEHAETGLTVCVDAFEPYLQAAA
jgi:nitrile hydratase